MAGPTKSAEARSAKAEARRNPGQIFPRTWRPRVSLPLNPGYALRPPMRLHRLDGEVLFDCDLSARRIPIA